MTVSQASDIRPRPPIRDEPGTRENPRVLLGRTGRVGHAVPLLWALLWERTHWLVTSRDGDQVPVLDPQLWDLWLPLLLVVLVASVVLEIAKYRAGRWNVRLALVNTILNVAFAGIVLWISATNGLLNPALTGAVAEGATGLAGGVAWVIVAIAVIDTASGWWHALRDSGARIP